MRWKWRLGLLVIAAVEALFLPWISIAMGGPPDIVLYAGGILALVLVAMLVMRPLMFLIMTLWLGGLVGAAWYFLRYLPPTFALALGAAFATLASAVGAPLVSRILGLVLRGRVLVKR